MGGDLVMTAQLSAAFETERVCDGNYVTTHTMEEVHLATQGMVIIVTETDQHSYRYSFPLGAAVQG